MLVSVIIPSFNKEKRLKLVLHSLLKQNCGQRFEVIVVDDGSTDHTRDTVLSFDGNPIFNLKYVNQPNQGRSVARNTGIKNAQGDIILFLDDDRFVKEDFLQEHLRIFAEAQGSGLARDTGLIVLGRRMNLFISKLEHFYEDIRQTIQDHPEDIYKRAREEHYWKTIKEVVGMPAICWIAFVTGNVSLGAGLLEKVGLFNEGFQGWGLEDMELGYRLWLEGVPFFYNEAAVNYHFEHVSNRQELFENDFGRNLEYCLQIHPSAPMRYFYQYVKGELNLAQFNQMSQALLGLFD